MKAGAKLLLSGLLLGVTGYVGVRPMAGLPALGAFLDPVHGVWGVARTAEIPAEEGVVIPELEGEVTVVYDDRRVPHIYASSTADAYRAQGWVVARDRLFQLEVQARATAGTLTELAGDRALTADRSSRGLGLAWAADRDWARLAERPELAGVLEAYADGVNAYIGSLSRSEWPLEYHLLGAQPMVWRAVHTLYLLKRMGWTLAYSSTEFRKAAVAGLVGQEAADALIPINSPIQEPIEPHRGTRVLTREIPPPGEPDAHPTARVATLDDIAGPMELSRIDDGGLLGSNNWAVGPSRSATGRPILAGDPHLELTLPSIWYEAHLVVPGELDVYGVTLAGTPGIVVGFNRDIAWTFTNTGHDALDHYRERLDDREAPERYMLDGTWRELELRAEEYFGPAGELLLTDTIYHTHRGPVRFVNDEPMSLRWTVLDGQGEVDALLGTNRAGSVEEWLEATAGYQAPTQNGLVADRHGSIAIRSQGVYPIRPENTTGDWAYDGTTSASDWVGRLDRVPFAIDPEQGYLASANQQPVDPEAYGAFIGGDWPSPWRALTINGLLRAKERHSADDFVSYQTHPSSARAEYFAPAFVEAAQAVLAGLDDGATLGEAAGIIGSWDVRYDRENTGTVLFEAAMAELEERLWDELEDGDGRRVATPSTQVTWALLRQPASPWWDDLSTDLVETRDVILAQSLEAAYTRLRAELGGDGRPGWRWGDHRFARLRHLLGIPALSRAGLSIQGGPGLLNPSSGAGGHGASWRMVVELGDDVRARATYPGGQSGNPVSSSYTDRLDAWVAGELDDLRYPASIESLEAGGFVRARLTLAAGGSR
jgi:penicillin amidase